MRVIRAGMAIVDQDVAGWQHLQGCDPCQLNSGKIILVQAPDNLIGGRDFDHGVAIAGADQGVAIFESQCGKCLIAEGIDTVSRPTLASEQRHRKLPLNAAVPAVLTDDADSFMAYQKVPVFKGEQVECRGGDRDFRFSGERWRRQSRPGQF